MRKWFGMLLMSMLLMAGCMQVSAAESGVLALGANLSDSQKAEVYAQMGITAEQAASYQTIYITMIWSISIWMHLWEHRWLELILCLLYC